MSRGLLLLALVPISGCISDASAGFRWGGASGDDEAEWEDVCTIDFSLLSSATWTDGTQSLSCDSGSNGSAFNWTITDSGNSTVFGPDGSAGVDINPTTGTLWWTGNNDAPRFDADLDDLTGDTVSRDDVWMITVEFGGDTISANYEAFGIGILDAESDGWSSRHVYLSTLGGESWRTARFVAGSVSAWTDRALSSVDTLQLVLFGDRVARFGYGTSGMPVAGTLLTQVDATKDAGTFQVGNPGTTVAKFDPSSARFRIFVEEQNAGGTYHKIVEKLRVERATP